MFLIILLLFDVFYDYFLVFIGYCIIVVDFIGFSNYYYYFIICGFIICGIINCELIDGFIICLFVSCLFIICVFISYVFNILLLLFSI